MHEGFCETFEKQEYTRAVDERVFPLSKSRATSRDPAQKALVIVLKL